MSEQHDRQVQQAAQQALHEIARLHEHAVTAVWEQYSAPVPRHARDRSAHAGLSGSLHQGQR